MARQGIADDAELKTGCWTGTPVVVSYDASTASTQLQPGVYFVNATGACHFRQGASDVAATTSSHYLPSGATVTVVVTDATANGYIAFIKASGASAGSAYISQPTRG